jgi:hypothetical protein
VSSYSIQNNIPNNFFKTYNWISVTSSENLTNISTTRSHVKWTTFHYGVVHPKDANGGDFLHTKKVGANILNKQSRRAEICGPPVYVLGVMLTTLTVKYEFNMECHKGLRTWTDPLDKRPKLRYTVMKFLTWNVRSLYRVGWLMTVAKGITKYKWNLVRVQEVR